MGERGGGGRGGWNEYYEVGLVAIVMCNLKSYCAPPHRTLHVSCSAYWSQCMYVLVVCRKHIKDSPWKLEVGHPHGNRC